MSYRITAPTEGDLAELAEVAARTFPLACPPSVSVENATAFINEHLSESKFTAYRRDPSRVLLIVRENSDSPILGYAMLIAGVPDDPDVQRAVTIRPAVELSKMYVLPEAHGGMVASALMNAALGRAWELHAQCVWLGVNQENERAQRFYAKHGFVLTGTKTFTLGTHVEADYVMVRSVG